MSPPIEPSQLSPDPTPSSPPQPNPQPQRLPQKPLPGLQPPLDILIPTSPPQLKSIPPKNRRHDQRELHLGHIPPHTAPRPIAKRNKALLLPFGQIPRAETVWTELVCVRAPDLGAVVDRVRGHGERGPGWEVVRADGDAGPGWDDAWEAEGGGGVDAEGFGDDVVETGGARVG